METYVYVDTLFFLNFIMAFVIIRLAGSVCGRKGKRLRGILGAAVASVIYVLSYLYGGGVISFLAGFAGMLAGLAISYAPIGLIALKRLALWTLALTVALGGGCMAAYYILVSMGLRAGLSLWFPAAGAVLAWVLVKFTAGKVRQGVVQMANVSVRVSVSGRTAAFTAFVDTGHSLVEPISGKPVVVAEFTALKCLLPDEINRMFHEKTEDDLENCAAVFTHAGFANRLRLLPYASIGERNGILIGFRPDCAVVGSEPKDVIIAVYNDLLSNDGNYAALVGADLMEDKYGV